MINIDCTVCLEAPKIAPFIPEMRKTIASLTGTDPDDVSVKATTTEKMGFTGRGEGAVALSAVLITREA